MASTNWVFWLLVVLVALMFISGGGSIESQPLIAGAASLLTIPLTIFNILAGSTIGVMLLPLLFIGLLLYFKKLEQLLGHEVIYFIIFAALLVALNSTFFVR